MSKKPLGKVTKREVTESGAKISVKLTEEGLEYVDELLRKEDAAAKEFIKGDEIQMKDTRFEEVKSMTVEELAQFIDMATHHDDWCKIPPLKDCPHKTCQECIVDWLNEKV